MNETLRRALLQARLSEEDVAARLEVDPKTVRRWLEGRLPYRRHRWALAVLLALDEADLWPQLRTARSRPEEVLAIYPHSERISRDVWQNLFRSAQREIGILTDSGAFIAEDLGILGALRDRAEAGVIVRICLRRPDSPGAQRVPVGIRDALAQGDQCREVGNVEIRLHDVTLSNSIYRADDELIIGQHAFGVPASAAPVLHLRGDGSTGLVATYLGSFEQVWADSRPIA